MTYQAGHMLHRNDKIYNHSVIPVETGIHKQLIRVYIPEIG